MGFFKRLFGGKDDEGEGSKKPRLSSQAASLKKKITNKYGQPQDRQRAIQLLGEMGNEEACYVLLQRYTFRIEQSITDEEEKRMVYNELVKIGRIAVKPILEFLTNENAPYWPIKVLREVIGDQETVTHLIDIIDKTEAIFDRDVERKVELIANLRDFTDPRVKEKLLSFVNDENEDIKCQALLGLAQMGDEEMVDILMERLLDPNESQRVKNEVLNLFIEKKWKIKRKKEEIRKIIPQTYWIDDVGVIHRKQV